MPYGLFTYNYSNNIGDEIQSIAAEGFLPRTDLLIERDRLNWYVDGRETFVIFNGWFTRQPCWPPPRNFQPLFVSFYAHRPDDLIKREYADYFRRFGPIGCRSVATAEAFQKAGVDAYFSGCLTLTIPKTARPRTDRIYTLDVEPELYERLVPGSIKRTSIMVSNAYPEAESNPAVKSAWLASYFVIRVLNKLDKERIVFPGLRRKFERFRHNFRMRLARERLNQLSEAKLVITSRLHCAMPCLALGTPVVLLRSQNTEADRRFSGLLQLVRHGNGSCSAIPINWDNPEPNSDDYLAYAQALKKRCRDAVDQFARSDAVAASPRPSQLAGAAV